MRNIGNGRQLTLFFLLAYVIAWIAWVPLIISQKGLGWIRADVPFEAIIPGAFAPTIAAIAVQWLTKRDFRICRFIGSWRRFLPSLIVGLAAVMLGEVIIPVLAMTRSIDALHWNILLSWTAYQCNYSTFLGGPLNEEPGWRGFALPKLQARFGPYRAALILGVLWTGWHLPLFLIHGWIGLPIWGYAIWVIGLSILITFVFNISRGSIIICILMHALFNTSAILLGGLLGNVPLRPHSWLIYLCAGAVMPLAIILCTRGRLGIGNREQ